MTTKEMWLELKPYITRQYVAEAAKVPNSAANKVLCGDQVGTENEAKVAAVLRGLKEDLDKRLNRKK